MALETLRTNSPAKRSRSRSPPPTNGLHTPRKKARNLAQKPNGSMAENETSDPSEAVAGVCALTNSCLEDLQQSYLIPRDAPSDLIDDLEFSWGMDPGMLDLDDASNLLRLSPTARESFEAGQWALLPSDFMVSLRMYQYSEGEESAEIKRITDIYEAEKKDAFPFRIIPLFHFDTLVSRRPDPDSCRPFKYLFSRLPEITLRIHPHLVVVDFITKYRRLTDEERKTLRSWLWRNMMTVVSDIDLFETMYEKWVPTKEFDHEYAHLPALGRKLDCLVRPNDSISILSVDIGSNSDQESEDFSETDTSLKNRIVNWAEAVAKALDKDPKEPPMPTSYPIPPSTPPSPTAPSPHHSPPADTAT